MLSSKISIYKYSDFIPENHSKELTYDRVVDIIQKISSIAAYDPDCNILLDFRDTVVATSIEGFREYTNVSWEMLRNKFASNCKIANLLPLDKERLIKAKTLEAAAQLQGLKYRVFTDYDEAINWLSE